MAPIATPLETIKVCCPFFDKLAFRTARPPPMQVIGWLRENCSTFEVHLGKPIRGSLKRYLVTVVAPNANALRFLAAQRGWMLNAVEVALDIVVPDADVAKRLKDLFFSHFVQRWHGSRRTRPYMNGVYTGRRGAGVGFVGYGDRPSKITGDPHCFHFEGRYQGVEAVRRIGLHHPRDLLTFDHAAYWARHMQLRQIVFERLGRFHLNRLEGRRRHRPAVERHGPVTYAVDRRVGGALFRALGFDPAHNVESLSVQWLLDRYGGGPFMSPIDTSALMPVRHVPLLISHNSPNHPMQMPSISNVRPEPDFTQLAPEQPEEG